MTWFVMRDLTRANASRPAWKELTDAGFRVFTPMVWKVRKRGNRQERYQTPAIHDLLFVESTRADLDPEVARRATLQYRFVRGGSRGEAMTVAESEMERFIRATTSTDDPKFYMPSELTPSMIGKEVLIVGGPLDGMTGHLLSVRGMRTRRLIVELPGMLTSAVEVSPDYIRFV
ncbi:MAG: UpxY family transcription antiterminator [Muribaculaceae bacterium]|nr:UpxY family transcription antiterminator [Muribaculaceae bacterium]